MGATGIAIGGLSARSYASIMLNERITKGSRRMWGKAHINAWAASKSHNRARWMRLFPAGSKSVADKTGEKPLTEWDLRKVLDDKEIDAVSLAIPNHWHALATIWACQAGKHAYVEKPAMHNIWEGRKMIEAARKYDRRVQVGFQNRSIPEVMAAMKFLHDGGIGKIYMARGTCIKPRDSFGIAKDSTPPRLSL